MGRVPNPREATVAEFRSAGGELLDTGLALFFPGPASYTGEDVLELHAHGSPITLERLVDCVMASGARMAHPGEFTERAFRNDKLDLTQAEAVADLIASGSAEAARAATRSLSGEFSRAIHRLDEQILKLRVFVESAIDFAEEEIEFLGASEQETALQSMTMLVDELLERSDAGLTLQIGLDVAITGPPNVGKSSLLNQLLGEDRAIVTDIAGTTRDVLHGELTIDGMPVRLTDTAGLHASDDPIEAIGMERAETALAKADCILWVVDDAGALDTLPPRFPDRALVVRNKCDLTNNRPGKADTRTYRTCALSGAGLNQLREALKEFAGYRTGIDAFAGRPRHIVALKHVRNELMMAIDAFKIKQGELVAENLRMAHEHLGEIVGLTTSDDLLGKIFATFCIGK